MALSPKQLVTAALGLAVVVLLADPVMQLGRHTVSYRYLWGGLGTKPAWFWAGPFTGLHMGVAPHEYEGIRRPLPQVYLHPSQGAPIAIHAYTEPAFVERFGPTSATGRIGRTSGQLGDAELGFMKGRLVRIDVRAKLGWPCFSKDANSERFCPPFSRSDARELFGEPHERRSRGLGWH